MGTNPRKDESADLGRAARRERGTRHLDAWHRGAGRGLLDGLEFDLSGLDLGSLSDMHFDASYDLIGSDPGEQGWWTDLASDHNHDGAYETSRPTIRT